MMHVDFEPFYSMFKHAAGNPMEGKSDGRHFWVVYCRAKRLSSRELVENKTELKGS